jgi:glyoxylase-like metal-dependent hydrolase (beta-lactamase superfamily II)
MEITGVIQKQAWVDRTVPPVERVRSGIWSIPVDFSLTPVRYTFAYLVLNGAGQGVLIDPGYDSDLGRSQILAGLERAGVTLGALVGIVSTHLHPDHLGMVEHLTELTDAWVGMHPAENEVLDQFRDVDGMLERDRLWRRAVGIPEERDQEVAQGEDSMRYLAGLARADLPLNDGDLLPLPGRTLRVVATPGHTPGHICIVDEDERVVFSGDHVLPRITSNVGLTTAGDRGHPLADYYASLTSIKRWGDYEVFPAHEYRFSGLAGRADDLAQHHRDRAEEIVAVAGTDGTSVYSIAQRISWSRSWESLDGLNLRAALSETLAHVDYLLDEGRLEIVGDGLAPRLVRIPRPSAPE